MVLFICALRRTTRTPGASQCRIPTHVQHRARSLRLSTNRPGPVIASYYVMAFASQLNMCARTHATAHVHTAANLFPVLIDLYHRRELRGFRNISSDCDKNSASPEPAATHVTNSSRVIAPLLSTSAPRHVQGLVSERACERKREMASPKHIRTGIGDGTDQPRPAQSLRARHETLPPHLH